MTILILTGFRSSGRWNILIWEQKGVEYSVQMLEEIMCGSEKSTKPPCIVFCRNLPVDDRLIELATKYQVPILRTKRATNEFMADLIQCLNYNMAPRCTVHGVLVDIYGEGILIMGESGIGKSEVALELIHRGHRLVSDDVVEIKRINESTLLGSAPTLRGILSNCVVSVLLTQNHCLV